MTDRPTSAEPAATSAAWQVLADLRAQDFSSGPPSRVLDPIVEPLWTGLRALAAVGARGVSLVDTDGRSLENLEAIVDALALAVPAEEAVVEGYVTKQAQHVAGAAVAWSDEMPSMSSLVGLRRNRAVDTLKLKEGALDAGSFAPDDPLAFVTTDLLWIDDTSLLDVPLLERRRLLEAVLIESDDVRLGAFVRPPIEHWVASWRTQGFSGLTYKAANSRYLPGLRNPDWIIAGMPRR